MLSFKIYFHGIDTHIRTSINGCLRLLDLNLTINYVFTFLNLIFSFNFKTDNSDLES